MEFLSPFLVPLKEEAHKAFLKDGRVIPEWRTAMRDVGREGLGGGSGGVSAAGVLRGCSLHALASLAR
jgi:hypothetical protein